MNEYHEQERNHQSKAEEQQPPQFGFDHALETHIAHVLHEQAEQIHLTPAMRRRFLQHLPTHPMSTRPKRMFAPLIALTAAALFTLLLSLYATQLLSPPHAPITTLVYRTDTTLLTPNLLAQDGTLLSLDPTGQHLVYAPAHQPGVMYVTDITNPIAHNVLTMRDAYSVAWSPDGTSLVTTIYPLTANAPLLALATIGHYMHPLGKNALAASWSPTTSQEITFVTPGRPQAQPQLWMVSPSGIAPHLLASMPIPLLIQSLNWSPDGHPLAIMATTAKQLSQQTLEGPGRALYLMNALSGAIQQIIAPGNFTLSHFSWSPDSHTLLYEQQQMQSGLETTSLRAINAVTHLTLFTLPVQALLGFSWSPHSSALIYSDNGTLHTYTLRATPITLPILSELACYPFWLPDGRILYLHIHNGVGQLALLRPSTLP